MLQNLVLLISLMFLVLVIGGGWGKKIANLTDRNNLKTLMFWSLLVGMMIPTIISSFVIAVNLHIKYAWIGTAVFALLGWGLSPRWQLGVRKTKGNKSSLMTTLQILFAVLFVLFLCGFSAENAVDGGHPLRIGPDAIGNATAISGLAKGDTLNSIANELRTSTGIPLLEEILDPQSHNLYTTPSIQTQIKTEFLVAGLRWGFSGTGGMMTWLFGLKNLWLILNALGNLALVCVALGIWVVLDPLQLLTGAKAFAILSGTLSPMLLNGYREGGVAQVWVVPTSLALLIVMGDQKIRYRSSILIIGSVLAMSAVAYSDLFILQGAILTIFVLLSIPKKQLRGGLIKAAGGLAVACALSPVFFVKLITYIPRRLADAGIGGWAMPHWTNISESIGLLNRYNQASPNGIQMRTPIGATNAIFIDVLIVILAIYTITLAKKETDVRFSLAAAIVVLGIRYKSQVVDQVSNYQYFKAFGTLMPIISIGLVISIFSQTENNERMQNFFRSVIACIFCALMVSSSFNYSSTFREQSTFLPHEYQTQNFLDTIRKLDSVNYFAPLNVQITSLAAYTTGAWLGRGTYQLKEKLSTVRNRPVYVLVSKTQCGTSWQCIANVAESRMLFKTQSLAAYQIANNTDFLKGENLDNDWSVRASEASVFAGGPQLNWSYIPH
jgi:hypothetical protein